MTDPTIAFHLFGRPILWYGILFALGFITAITHWGYRAKQLGWPKEIASDLALWIMIGGILGARTAYVLANLSYFAENPAEIIRVDHGGLVYYGGMIGAIIAYLLFGLTKKIKRLPLGDFAISAIPLAHAFGRAGCHINVCCFGAKTDAPWAIHMGGVLRHPTQLIEITGNLSIYALMLYLYPKLKKPGQLMIVYLFTYPVMRFLVEFLRGDERSMITKITTAQFTSILLFIAGLILLYYTHKQTPHDDTTTSHLHG